MIGPVDVFTHYVEVTVSATNPHSGKHICRVSMGGDGSIHHMIHAFRSALLAAGFSAEVVINGSNGNIDE